MCVCNVSKYSRKRIQKNKRRKNVLPQITRVWLVVMMMMVYEHIKRTFGLFHVLLFFTLLRCPLRPYTYTHTPSHHQLRALIRIFFSTHKGARVSCRARSKSAFVFSFSSFSLSCSLSLGPSFFLTRFFFSLYVSCFATRPYDRIRRQASLLLYSTSVFCRVRKNA